MKHLLVGTLATLCATLGVASAKERETISLPIEYVDVLKVHSDQPSVYIRLRPAGARAMAAFSLRHIEAEVSVQVAGHELTKAFISSPMTSGIMVLVCHSSDCNALGKQIRDAGAITLVLMPRPYVYRQ
jgi:hypothetical protein